MTKTVRIPVPPKFNDPDADFDLTGYFQQFVDSELRPALDTDVWELDERASVYEIEVADADASDGRVVVTYNVLFNAYYGCRDMNYAGEDEREITGTRVGEHWTFAHNKPRERRNTLEEF